MENIKVRDCMINHPATVDPNMDLITAVKVLLDKQQSAAAVVDPDGHLLGLLSEADCIAATFRGGLLDQGRELVSDKMSTELESINADSSIIASVDRFLANNRRVLPVLEGKKLVGMLTRENILRALIEELDHPTQHAKHA